MATRNGKTLERSSSQTTIDDGAERTVEAAERQVASSGGTNFIQTLMNMLNGFIGSGILTMPSAFRDGGILVAAILNPFIGLLSCFCIHLLIRVNIRAMQKHQLVKPYSYPELGRNAMELGPKKMHKFSRFSGIFVSTAIVSNQLGGCCVYLIFIATNIEVFLAEIFGKDAPRKELCLVMILPFVILMNSIRSIKKLSYASMLSNLFQLIGITIILFNLFQSPRADYKDLHQGERFPRFLVSNLFIFEGIAVSLGLFQAIDKPRNFYKPLGVLNVGMVLITFFYWIMGFFGYLKYGNSIEGTITVNLPNYFIFNVIRLLYAFAVLLTYPLIMFVTVQEFLPLVQRHTDTFLVKRGVKKETKEYETKQYIAEQILRASLVIFTYALAALIPNVDKMVGLVGAMTSSVTAVTIPAVMYLIVFWDDYRGKFRVLHCLMTGCLIVIGIYGFVFGVWDSLVDIIKHFGENDNELDHVIDTLLNPLDSTTLI